MEAKNTDAKIDDNSKKDEGLAAQAGAKIADVARKVGDAASSAQGEGEAAFQKGGHRLQETAKKAAHVAKEIATKVVHSAEETVEKIVHRAKESTDKAKHRGQELSNKAGGK